MPHFSLPRRGALIGALCLASAAVWATAVDNPLGQKDWHTADYPGRTKVMWTVISRDLQSSFPRGGSPVKVGRFPQDEAKILSFEKLGVAGAKRLVQAGPDSVLLDTPNGFLVVTSAGDLGKAETTEIPPREIAVATGIYRIENERLVISHDGVFEPVNQFGRNGLPDQEVRDVDVDTSGRLFVATASGIGVLSRKGKWSHLTGKEGGLPVNDVTALSFSPGGKFLWVGTAHGAARRNPDGKWNYRMGRRWMLGEEVLDIAALDDGGAWILTSEGVTRLTCRMMTLREKANEIDAVTQARHVRHGAVSECTFRKTDDPDSWYITDNDNDGLWTSIYLGAKCFQYAATKDPEALRLAKEHFNFLVRLQTINGHPGYIARSIRPSKFKDGSHEKYKYGREGEWHESTVEPGWQWKSDTSSDELCGHFFAYGVYYDLVAKGDKAEEKRVQEHVRALMNGIIDHDFNFVDIDGHPTRWGIYNPKLLGGDMLWSDAMAFNALGIIAHLKTAIHICGDQKFKDAYDLLIKKHHYDVKLMQAKEMLPNTPFAGVNHSDDEMAWLYYYHLLSYPDADEDVAWRYRYSAVRSMRPCVAEKSPFFNFPFAVEFPRWAHVADGIDTLKRWPIDLREWRVRNSQRDDVLVEPRKTDRHSAPACLVMPLDVDERAPKRWNANPYVADTGREDGRVEQDGGAWLLPYWMGVYHGFIEEDASLTENYIAFVGDEPFNESPKKERASRATNSSSTSQ